MRRSVSSLTALPAQPAKKSTLGLNFAELQARMDQFNQDISSSSKSSPSVSEESKNKNDDQTESNRFDSQSSNESSISDEEAENKLSNNLLSKQKDLFKQFQQIQLNKNNSKIQGRHLHANQNQKKIENDESQKKNVTFNFENENKAFQKQSDIQVEDAEDDIQNLCDTPSELEVEDSEDLIKKTQSSNILDNLNLQVGSLVSNSHQISNFHEGGETKEHTLDQKEKESLGSISSADELEMQLLFEGDHFYQFQAVQRIKKKQKEIDLKREQTEELLDRHNSFIQSFLDFMRCKDRSKRQQTRAGLVNQLNELNDPSKIASDLGLVPKTAQQIISNQRRQSIANMNFRKSQTIESGDAAFNVSQDQKFQKAQNFMSMKNPNSTSRNSNGKGSLWKKARSQCNMSGLEKSPKNKVIQKSSFDYNDPEFEEELGHGSQVQDIEEDENDNEESTEHNHDECGGHEMPNLEDSNDELRPRNKCSQKLKKFMIYPDEPRLKKFHLIVSIAFYVDFCMTSFILGNYRFQIGQERENFFYHNQIFFVLICIQVTDICLNFFKVQVQDVTEIDDPIAVAINYIYQKPIYSPFIIDVVAVLPWAVLYPRYIFLRYLTAKKFGIYQVYIDEFMMAIASNFMNNEMVKKINNASRLLIQVFFVSHFFANVWILIGLNEMINNDDGWIKRLIEMGIQKDNFSSLYITSFYWVITSFSSVGYGDVIGLTFSENLFQMLVEMAGIAFFGFMIGTFQTLIQGIRVKDQIAEQTELIDLWLIQLDQARQKVTLEKSIFEEVHTFHTNKYKYDSLHIQQSCFFEQLKPRLKKQILDSILKSFYQTFNNIFDDIDSLENPQFRREILSQSQFRYLSRDYDNEISNPEWIIDQDIPVIEKCGEMSQHVNLVVQGCIHIMNKEGMYEYGVIQEGGYFGDISIILNQPSEYSYFYNPNNEKPVLMLQIEAKKFLEICETYPLAHEILKKRAVKRKELFENYKTIILLKYMKAIKTSPNILRQKDSSQNKDGLGLKQNKIIKHSEIRLDLFKAFIKQYELSRYCRKMLKQQERDNHIHGFNINYNSSDKPQDLDATQKSVKNHQHTKKPNKIRIELMEAKKKACEIDKKVELKKRSISLTTDLKTFPKKKKLSSTDVSPINIKSGVKQLRKSQSQEKENEIIIIDDQSTDQVIPEEMKINKKGNESGSSSLKSNSSISNRIEKDVSPIRKFQPKDLKNPQYESDIDKKNTSSEIGDDKKITLGDLDSKVEGAGTSINRLDSLIDSNIDEDCHELQMINQQMSKLDKMFNSSKINIERKVENMRQKIDNIHQTNDFTNCNIKISKKLYSDLDKKEEDPDKELDKEGGDSENEARIQRIRDQEKKQAQSVNQKEPLGYKLNDKVFNNEEADFGLNVPNKPQNVKANISEAEMENDSFARDISSIPVDQTQAKDSLEIKVNESNSFCEEYTDHKIIMSSDDDVLHNPNYKNLTLQQIEKKIKNNQILIKHLLRDYFKVRQKEVRNELQRKLKDYNSKNNNQMKRRKSAINQFEQLREETVMNHQDCIIEEYMSLSSINDQYLKRNNIFSHNKYSENSIINSVEVENDTQDHDAQIKENFEQLNKEYISKLNNRIEKFDMIIDKKLNEVNLLLDQKIQRKIDYFADNFDSMDIAQKEFFFRKYIEKQQAI